MSDRNHTFRLTLVLLVIVHGVILWLLLNRQLDFLFNDAMHRIGPGTDFWAYFNAGKHFIQDGSIYGLGPGMGFRYHPFSAMTLFSMISLVGYDPAYYIWVLFTEFLFFTVLVRMRKSFSQPSHYLTAVTLMICFSPYYLELYMGNATFIASSFLLCAYWAYRDHKIKLFYSFYFVSLFIKPVGILLLPYFLIKKRYKIVAITVSGLVLTALPYFLLYPEQWIKFMNVNFEGYAVEPGFMVHAGNQGFYAFWLTVSAWLHDIPLRQFYSLTQLSNLSMILIRMIPWITAITALWYTIKMKDKKPEGLLWGVWFVVYLVGYKEIWEHSYSMFIPLVLLLLNQNIRINRWALIGIIGMALPTFFFLYDIPLPVNGFYDPDWFWDRSLSLVHHATKPFWLFLLLFSFFGIQPRVGSDLKNH